MNIVEFLRARLDEDEAVARSASPAPWSYPGIDSVAGGMLYDTTRTIAAVVYEQPGDHDGSIVRHLLVPEADANGAHIARHDPARVLREVEAKRRIVERHTGCDDVSYGDAATCPDIRALAAVYAEHPDYDPEWR